MCLLYFVMHVYMSHVVTRAGKTTHRHVKHIGAWSPGLAPHPGEASPGGRMDQLMKVLERLWNIITCKQRSSRFTTQMHYHALSVYDRCLKTHEQKWATREIFGILMKIEPEKNQGNHIHPYTTICFSPSTNIASSSVAIRRASLSLAWPHVGLSGGFLDFSLKCMMETRHQRPLLSRELRSVWPASLRIDRGAPWRNRTGYGWFGKPCHVERSSNLPKQHVYCICLTFSSLGIFGMTNGGNCWVLLASHLNLPGSW